jgi:hypothetical protein
VSIKLIVVNFACTNVMVCSDPNIFHGLSIISIYINVLHFSNLITYPQMNLFDMPQLDYVTPKS